MNVSQLCTQMCVGRFHFQTCVYEEVAMFVAIETYRCCGCGQDCPFCIVMYEL